MTWYDRRFVQPQLIIHRPILIMRRLLAIPASNHRVSGRLLELREDLKCN